MATATKAKAKKSTKQEVVHLAIILDESGSMRGSQRAVVDGTNEYVGNLRSDLPDDKDVRVSLTMFDFNGHEDNVREKWAQVKLADAPELSISDYNPRGGTPLNDAIITVIKTTRKRVKKGDKVLVTIFTDGLENSSETSTDDLRKAIVKAEKDGWRFIYLGANQDSFAEGGSRGIRSAQSFRAFSTSQGTGSTMSTASSIGSVYASASPQKFDETMDKMEEETGNIIPEAKALDAREYVSGKKETKEK